MPRFRFSMIDSGIERVDYVEIPEDDLQRVSHLFPPGHSFHNTYRQNVIQTRLNAWALSKLQLSYEEVIEDEGNSDHAHSTTAEPEAQAKADERGLQKAAES